MEQKKNFPVCWPLFTDAVTSAFCPELSEPGWRAGDFMVTWMQG